MLSVAEYFYSLQGEGVTMGIPAVFLRLAGCNLLCGGKGTAQDKQLHDGATWRCDTIEVWMKGRAKSNALLVTEMQEQLGFIERLRDGAHLVITGGEPLMQQAAVVDFLIYLEETHQLVPIVEIETNATVMPLPDLDQRVHYWNTSPKLSNSGEAADRRIIADVLRWFANNPKTMTKLVISSPADWDEIKTSLLDTGLINKKQIVLMPAADSIAALLETNKMVADCCIREGLRMCTRLHVEIWNQLTGV